jgi:hypothetical protein
VVQDDAQEGAQAFFSTPKEQFAAVSWVALETINFALDLPNLFEQTARFF